MNPFVFAMRRPFTTQTLVVALATAGVLVHQQNEQPNQRHRKIVLTRLKAMDVTITQPYVCQIRSPHHINIRASQSGYLAQISVRDGQAVRKGDVMFKIVRARGSAKADLPKAKSDFTNVIAPFDGIVGRLHEQSGSPIKQEDVLATLADNSVMMAYFKVPEAQYLEYMANRKQHEEDKIELVLANQTRFSRPGKFGAIGAKFDETGRIPFRADFPNPDGVLRHGDIRTIQIHRTLHDATAIPMRATFDIMDKRYVYVVDKDDVVHQRQIIVQNEADDDIFVIQKGVGVGDRIVLEGIRQVRDGEKVEYEFRPLEAVMRKLKDHAE